MASVEYVRGRDDFLDGRALTDNPFDTGTEAHEDWLAGWGDASVEADRAAAALAETQPEDTQPKAEETEEDAVEALGDAGYRRILELLNDPPVGDDADLIGELPPEGEVPEDLDDWLAAWKEPLARVTVATAVDVVQHKLRGSTRGRLRELYRGMPPHHMAAAMNQNADQLVEYANQRAVEAGLLASVQAKVTQTAARYMLTALLMI